MQKKLLALAVAGALAPAAAMAQSTVEIYGRANLGIDNWRATGAATATGNMKSRNRIFDSGSRLGFPRERKPRRWSARFRGDGDGRQHRQRLRGWPERRGERVDRQLGVA
jgi:hypothetical protein